jgi:hypothetical protein
MKRRFLHILSFVLIVAGSLSLVWLLQSDSERVNELQITDAISRLDRGDFKEARFKTNAVEFTDRNGIRFVTTFGSDATRELLELKVHEFMEAGPDGMTMSLTVEPDSAPLSWILLRTAPFAIFFIGIGLALGLLVSRFIRK